MATAIVSSVRVSIDGKQEMAGPSLAAVFAKVLRPDTPMRSLLILVWIVGVSLGLPAPPSGQKSSFLAITGELSWMSGPEKNELGIGRQS
jgi:hypothetical protein